MIDKLLRSLPVFKGKQRLARFLLKNKIATLRDQLVDAQYGCRFKVPNIIENVGFDIFVDGSFEPQIIDLIVASIEREKVLLDIGANIGSICIPVLKRRPDISLIAVEAAAWVFGYLKFNIEANTIGEYTLFNRAVSDSSNADVAFYSPQDHFGKGSMASVFTDQGAIVKTITMDDLAATVPAGKSIGLVKMDIEGFEYHAFKGGASLLSKSGAPDILFEFVDWAEEAALGEGKTGNAQQILLDYGYRIRVITDGKLGNEIKTPLTKGSFMLYATKRDIAR